MTLFGKALREAPRITFGSTPPANGSWMQRAGGLVYLANEVDGLPIVNWQNAPTVTGWQRAITIIAATCAALPMWSTENDANGFPQRVFSPFDEFIYTEPNPEMSKQQFYELLFTHLASAGNFYGYAVDSTGNGIVNQIWPVMPHMVKPLRLADGRKGYVINDEFAEVDFLYGGNIIHIPGMGYDGLKGYDPITINAVTLGLSKATEQFAGSVFTEGGTPGGVLQTAMPLNQAQSTALRERWNEIHAGSDRNNRIAILDRGLEYKQIQPTAEAAQLLETRSFQVIEVARILGIPPHLLADVKRSTSWGTGIEEQGRGLVIYTLDHYIHRVMDTFSMTLLGGTKRRVFIDPTKLMQGGFKDLMGSLSTGINSRILNPNEARARIGYGPYDGGDEFLVPLNIGDDDPTSNDETGGSDGDEESGDGAEADGGDDDGDSDEGDDDE